MKTLAFVAFCVAGLVAVMAEYDRNRGPPKYKNEIGTELLLRTQFQVKQNEKCLPWEEREYEWGKPWGNSQMATCRSKCDDKYVTTSRKGQKFFCVPIKLLEEKNWRAYQPYVRMLGPVNLQEPCEPDEEPSVSKEGGEERTICTKKCRPAGQYELKNGTCQNKNGGSASTYLGSVSVLNPE